MLGHFPNLSNESYHAAHGISKSVLDKINISGLACWDAYFNPDREPREYKHCFLVGDGTHKIILEPNLFKEQYAVGFDKSLHPDKLDTMDEMRAMLIRHTQKISGSKSELIERLIAAGYPSENFMQHAESQYIESIGDRQVIPASDYKNMLASLNAVNKHHTASKLLKDAVVEQSYFAQDEEGLVRKCRPDFITANGQICCDVKTTDDVSARGFGRTIYKFRYDVQGAWYLDVLKMVLGNDAPKVFAFVALQKNRPYDISVQFLTDEQIARGRSEYQKNLTTLKHCLENNYWPGADNGAVLECIVPNYD